MGRAQVLRARLSLATLASLGLSAVFVGILRHDDIPRAQRLPFAFMLAFPLGAAAGIWWQRLGAQLLARGIWWSLLLLGALMAVIVGSDGHHEDFLLASFAAVALLAAGSAGLDQERGRFQPVAFRGTLLLALVLAMADTFTFLWLGVARLLLDRSPGVLLLVPPMIAGVVGLLRLRTWGLIVSLLSNVAVVVLSSTGVLALPSWFRTLYVASATLQLLVPVPMIVSIVRGRVPPTGQWRRTKRVVSTAVIAAVVALAFCGSFLHLRPFV
jgi:hypothetical protein